MTTYVFTPPPETYSTDWDDSAAWTPNGVPDDASAAVVIDEVAPPPGLYDSTGVVIDSGSSYGIGSLDLGAGMELTINGTLAVAGTVDLEGTLSLDGTLEAGSLTDVSGQNLTLNGVLDVSGNFTNGAQILGGDTGPQSGLLILASSFTNTGLIDGNVAIGTYTGGFANLAAGTLTGGIYVADVSDTIAFDVGALIQSDASDIVLNGGNITMVAPSGSQVLTIEQTLTNVAAGGTLQIETPTTWNALTVDGVLTVGRSFSPDDLVIDAGGLVLAGDGSISGHITNNGEIECGQTLGAAFPLIGDVTGIGTIVLDGTVIVSGLLPPLPSEEVVGASVLIDGSDTNDVQFYPGSGILELDEAPNFAGSILDFTASSSGLVGAGGNAIVLGGIAASSITDVSYTGNTSSGTLHFGAGGEEIDLRFVGDYTLASFAFSVDPSSSTSTDITENPCFVAGTAIDTPSGPVPVEHLRAGDAVRLHDGGTAPVTWTGHRRAIDARVVRLRPHALGPHMPRRDLLVSHDHALFVDNVLVPAHLLVNGISIVEERWPDATFHHVELATHAILLAEGAPAETYLDTGNRAQFGNCPLSYDPTEPAGKPCAELVVAGPRVDAARARVKLPALALATA